MPMDGSWFLDPSEPKTITHWNNGWESLYLLDPDDVNDLLDLLNTLSDLAARSEN